MADSYWTSRTHSHFIYCPWIEAFHAIPVSDTGKTHLALTYVDLKERKTVKSFNDLVKIEITKTINLFKLVLYKHRISNHRFDDKL